MKMKTFLFQCWNRVLGSIPSETILSSYLYNENRHTWKDPLSTIDIWYIMVQYNTTILHTVQQFRKAKLRPDFELMKDSHSSPETGELWLSSMSYWGKSDQEGSASCIETGPSIPSLSLSQLLAGLAGHSGWGSLRVPCCTSGCHGNSCGYVMSTGGRSAFIVAGC